MAQSINALTEQLAENLDEEEFAAMLANVQRLAGIGMLTAGISQELANLLSIVTTASISLRHELQLQDNPTDDIVQHYMSLIERNAFRADQIVAMLQGYGTLDTQQMAITDIDAILRDMMMLVERQFREESNVRVEVKASEEMQSLVCDHNRIVQLLVNLLLNARDAMKEPGGLIEVAVQPAHNGHNGNLPGTAVRPLDGIERIAISISDEGPENGQEENPRSAVSTKSNGNGAGLGLSIAHEIVRQHNGDIKFSNSRGPGKGASVTVVLPLRPSV